MKKLLAILITLSMILSITVIPVSANEIYYPCYEGTWSWDGGSGAELRIDYANSSNMNFYFRYGQFGVRISDAKVNGTNVSGSYYEVWDDGVNWENYVMQGVITLNLGDNGIWVNWSGSENGRWFDKGYMFYKSGFQYTTINPTNASVVLDGTKLEFDQNPVMVNDRILVPIRGIAEAMGAEVEWLENVRKVGSIVGITKGVRYIGFCAVNNIYNEYYNPFHMMIRDGDSEMEFVTLDAPVIIYNDRTMVPVRAVSEAFDANITWDGNTQTVNISTSNNGNNN